jgi:YidC/Oxa1 family membrane protein insertase
METRRLILLMVFSLSLIMLWDNYQASIGNPTVFGFSTKSHPSNNQQKQQLDAKPSTNEVPSVASRAPSDVPTTETDSVVVAPVKPEMIRVKTDVLELEFSNQGAQIVSSKLLKHASAHSASHLVQLFEQSDHRTYVFQAGLVGLPEAPNHKTLFEVVSRPGPFTAENPTQILSFKSTSAGLETIYKYTLSKDKYDIGFSIETKNVGPQVVTPSAYVQITRDDKPLETDSKLYSTFTGPAVYSEEGKYQKVSFDHIKKGDAEYTKKTNSGWIAMVQHYFVSAVVAQPGERENYVRSLGNGLYSVGLVSPLNAIQPQQTAKYSSTVYTGPQDQHTLAALAPGLDLVVDYGWLAMFANPIYWLLEKIHALFGNWGWAIVMLTVLIKLAFFPLSAASYRSMAKMRKIAPRMQQMKAQYGDDKMGFQRAVMEMYKREKINPLGGCMPILVQIPVFIALYWVLLASVEMRNAPWLGWVHDLASPDPFYILPIIMAITMFVQTKLNPAPPDPMQAKVMMIMPLVFSVMFMFFPAGLVLYWVVNNILSITQQWVITKKIESTQE